MTTKFQKGKSGNPAGKPKGLPDRRTALRELLQPHAGKLIQKAVDLALKGDPQALRLCFDRIVPALKATAEPVNTGLLPTTGTLTDQAISIYQAVARGEVTTDEGAAMMQILQGQARITETADLIARIETLEGKTK